MEMRWYKKLRLQGNSAIVTVPKEIVEKARLKDQEIYEFSIKLLKIEPTKTEKPLSKVESQLHNAPIMYSAMVSLIRNNSEITINVYKVINIPFQKEVMEEDNYVKFI